VLCDLVPGGVADEITAGHAAAILGQIRPAGPAGEARSELAAGLLDDIRHLDAQRREIKKKLAVAVKTSGTSLTEIFGVGPVVAATVIGDVVTVARFPPGTTSPPATAPPRSRCPLARRRPAGCRCAATAGSTTRSIRPRSLRSRMPTATAGPATSAKSPKGRPTRKHCAA
jgi:hypothetical protein